MMITLAFGQTPSLKWPEWEELCGQGSFYLFSEDLQSWSDAANNCELYGGYLAQIDSMVENFCLLEYINTLGFGDNVVHGLWHSANDIQSEGVIRQGDGRGPSFGDFLSWTPRFWSEVGGRSENCFYLAHTSPIAFGFWDDWDCSTPQYYICERTAPPAVSVF